MQFLATVLFAASALASLTAAHTIHFVNQDSTPRTIVFTAQLGLEMIENLLIDGLATANQTFPDGWIGNFYSVSKGKPDVPGMLGELRFDGYAGANFFDISAIVNPDDAEGVKMLFPKNSNTPVSGCQTFPCSNAYNKWDDVATMSTDDADLVCLIGNLSTERRRGLASKVSRDYVTGAL